MYTLFVFVCVCVCSAVHSFWDQAVPNCQAPWHLEISNLRFCTVAMACHGQENQSHPTAKALDEHPLDQRLCQTASLTDPFTLGYSKEHRMHIGEIWWNLFLSTVITESKLASLYE